MGCEILSRHDQAGLSWALDEISERLQSEAANKRWVFVEVKSQARSQSHLYLPALSRSLREACSQAKIFWVECHEKSAPSVVLKLLESSLCAGVLLRGLDQFPKAQPASIWGRRWQLASQASKADLFWVHEKPHPVIGFQQRISWLSGECEWMRGREDGFKVSPRRRRLEKNYQPAA